MWECIMNVSGLAQNGNTSKESPLVGVLIQVNWFTEQNQNVYR